MSADMRAATETAKDHAQFGAGELQNLAAAFLEVAAELEQEHDRCQHGIRWPHPCDDCERERQERDDTRFQAERKAREEAEQSHRAQAAEYKFCRERLMIRSGDAESAEQRAAELQGDNEELTKDLAWHKQYAMRWEQAASVAMKQAADLQARLDRVEAASLSAAALLQRWADQIKDCHTTEAGEWMDEEEAEADYNELIKAIRALSAQPKAAAKQFLETSEPSSGSAEPAPSAAPAERRKQERRIQPCETPHSRRFIERRNSAAPDAALPGLELAIQFHELYESLAPQFGYETRPETRQFDPESKNGKLMIAVCAEIERRRNKA